MEGHALFTHLFFFKISSLRVQISSPPPLRYLSTFVGCFFLLIFFLKDRLALPKYSWPCGLPLENGQLTGDYTPRAKYLSQQQTVAICSMDRGGVVCPALLSMLGLVPTWACTGFVRALVIALSPCVQLHCCVQERFPCSYPPPLGPALSLHPLCGDPCALGAGQWC